MDKNTWKPSATNHITNFSYPYPFKIHSVFFYYLKPPPTFMEFERGQNSYFCCTTVYTCEGRFRVLNTEFYVLALIFLIISRLSFHYFESAFHVCQSAFHFVV